MIPSPPYYIAVPLDLKSTQQSKTSCHLLHNSFLFVVYPIFIFALTSLALLVIVTLNPGPEPNDTVYTRELRGLDWLRTHNSACLGVGKYMKPDFRLLEGLVGDNECLNASPF